MTSHSQVCRGCLSSNVSFHYILGENVSTEIYCFCTSLKVQQDDLPKTLCDACYDLLLKYFKFKKTCLESQNTLLNSKFHARNVSSDEEKKYLDLTQNKDTDVLDIMKTENVSENYFDNKYIKTEDFSDHYNSDLFEAVNFSESSVINQPKLKQRRLRGKNQKKPRIKLKLPKKSFAFACNICNKKFNYLERLEAHKLEHDGKVAIINCLPCNKTFMTWSGLKRHNEIEHTLVSLDKLKCNVCGKVCKSQQTLKIHKNNHGERNIFVCDICGKGCKSKFILKAHIDTHRENRERNFTCEQCGKKFYTNSVLLSHMSKRHSGRRYICHVCSYPFTDKYNLAKHLLIHDGKKLYKCEICNKSYSTQASLVEHRRIHSGERPYICINCPKSFLSKRRLNDHHRVHTGERPYKCTICEQGFTQRGTLKRHMKVHDRSITVLN